jgi:hypothetical protein
MSLILTTQPVLSEQVYFDGELNERVREELKNQMERIAGISSSLFLEKKPSSQLNLQNCHHLRCKCKNLF